MKKIGFIDYYLDEWHANNYPQKIEEYSNGEMKVCYAYGDIDVPGKMTNREWADKMGVELCSSIEEVCEKSDYLVVLSPDNPEQHVRLCELPFKTGKRTYVDKTFAYTKAEAIKLFEMAEAGNTPMYSTSALRFADQLSQIDGKRINYLATMGGGPFDIYLIHQLEPIVTLMGGDVRRIMYVGTQSVPSILIEFNDGRMARTLQMPFMQSFEYAACYEDGSGIELNDATNFFDNFIKALIDFFRTGDVKAPKEQTIALISIIEASHKAQKNPGVWFDI